MSNRAPLVEKLIWIYVYVGLVLIGLGLSVRRADATIGWAILAVGIVLVWVRSRMKDTP